MANEELLEKIEKIIDVRFEKIGKLIDSKFETERKHTGFLIEAKLKTEREETRKIVREEIEVETKAIRNENMINNLKLQTQLSKLTDRVKNVEIDVSTIRKTAENLEIKVEGVNKLLNQSIEETAKFFHKTWAKMDETNERVTIIENHIDLPHKNKN